MLDFLMIATRSPKKDVVEIYPKFIVKKSNDLMIKGGDFYAVWCEELRLWSLDEEMVTYLIDKELDAYADKFQHTDDTKVRVLHMWDSDSGVVDRFHKYCQRQMRDNFHSIDERIFFANEEPKKRDYASKKLPYAITDGSIEAYDELMSVLYSPEERHKIEWAIGAIVTGASKDIQKFLVLYGSAGTGKSTVLNIIQDLFEGYYETFDAKALGNSNSAFALEPFKNNPLVAIQHDGDLSHIEDNTRLNSIVSHELMTVNEKFAKLYSARFNAFLLMGTNRPVKITDARSGILRRLIDVSPTGKKIDAKRYKQLTKQIKFELGPIANHCKLVFEEDPAFYDDYIPLSMMGASNDFYNFMLEQYDNFASQDGTTLKAAWDSWKEYCEYAKIPYSFPQRLFKEELKNYFRTFEDRAYLGDNLRVRNWFGGFLTEKFESKPQRVSDSFVNLEEQGWLYFEERPSLLDEELKDMPAQYGNEDTGAPVKKWENTKTTMKDIQSTHLHYVKLPWCHIVIDFDIPDKDGKKDFEANLKAASKWPKTYAELSKSGAGIHLHYIYEGDPALLSSVYDDHIEIKVFKGDQALRRKLTKCNDIPIAAISSGLPLREETKMIDFEGFKSEKALRSFVMKCLNKEHHGATKPEMDFLAKTLEDAYNSGMKYDISDMEPAVRAFANSSSNQRDICNKLYKEMKFKSEEPVETVPDSSVEKPIVLYDLEVFPNLFVCVYKTLDSPKVYLINPKPAQIDKLMEYRLVGFNNRRYDNHILWAAHLGMNNEQLYEISQGIIDKNESCFFRDAYNLSYTDIYDFSSKKQSLKKFEIELGIHHQELGLPWDKPVPEELWPKVAEYCGNDVDATEAVWYDRAADFMAREILADLAGGSVNDTTNQLTGKLIFGNEKNPQGEFYWRDLSQPVYELDPTMAMFLEKEFPEMMAERFGEAGSLLPYFPSYTFEHGKSLYLGEEVGEGGLVRAKPGAYGPSLTLDVASMHPHSAEAEFIFGRFTQVFADLVNARVYIKNGDYEAAGKLFDGKLKKYLTNPDDAKKLAAALKIAINSVYGLTAASFKNLFKDPNNRDNIVAKRGALFMLDLMYKVEAIGGTVIHIKTDSIKIANPTQELIDYILYEGKRHGYTFEVEHKFDKICLVNNAVYIAKLAEDDPDWMKDRDKALKNDKPVPTRWTATGAEFAVPYIFKTLFSKEPIEFDDLCETKEVKAGDIYLDFNENIPQLTDDEAKLLEKMTKAWDSNNPYELEKLQKKLNVGFEEMGELYSQLKEKEEQSHSLVFVGRIGRFCPVKEGSGGGILYRVQNGKKYAISGTTGYRWKEAEIVKSGHFEDQINKDYFRNLVDDAKKTIEEFVNFDEFAD